ncbi:hypothetical protein KC331_g2441 [Hortaea werneckii]|nr:hypothetical protein KC331_g2441 [Hortaea werneckii]KAI7715732.1 hypothetical protein KC353_g5868 [Hortaea werneckii]
MQLLNLLTLAALASAWVSPSDSTLTDPTDIPSLSNSDTSSAPFTGTGPLEAPLLEARGGGKNGPKFVWVCGANGGKCWKLRADDKQCKTATGNGLPYISLDGHLKCDLWDKKMCKGKANIKGVKGKFTVHNSLQAKKQGMRNILSFRCKKF